MKTRIDLKSALCGLFVGVLAILAVGAGISSNSSTESGRYQIVTAGNVALVIDTQTGKVWQKGWSSITEFKTDADFFESKSFDPKTTATKQN